MWNCDACIFTFDIGAKLGLGVCMWARLLGVGLVCAIEVPSV